MTEINIDDLPPDERAKVRYPVYAELIDILINEFGYEQDYLMMILGYDENWLDATHLSLTLPDLLLLVNRAKVESK